jgi:hypothetical protein
MNNEPRKTARQANGGDNEVDNVVHILSPLQFPRNASRPFKVLEAKRPGANATMNANSLKRRIFALARF